MKASINWNGINCPSIQFEEYKDKPTPVIMDRSVIEFVEQAWCKAMLSHSLVETKFWSFSDKLYPTLELDIPCKVIDRVDNSTLQRIVHIDYVVE